MSRLALVSREPQLRAGSEITQTTQYTVKTALREQKSAKVPVTTTQTVTQMPLESGEKQESWITTAMKQVYGIVPRVNGPDDFVTEAVNALGDLMQNSLADRTITGRSNLWKRFVRFLSLTDLEGTGDDGVLFIMSIPGIVPATRVNYLSGLLAVARATAARGWDEMQIKIVMKALRNQVKLSTPKQAVPASQEVTHKVFDQLIQVSPTTAMLVLAMWLGAARFADLDGLPWSGVVLLQEERVILDFAQSKTKPVFSPTRFGLLNGARIRVLSAWMMERKRLAHSEEDLIFGKVTPESLLRKVRAVEGAETWTLHSFRRGALQRILNLGTRGYQVSPESLARTARHRMTGGNDLPEVTIRYLADQRVGLSVMLTHLALGRLL